MIASVIWTTSHNERLMLLLILILSLVLHTILVLRWVFFSDLRTLPGLWESEHLS